MVILNFIALDLTWWDVYLYLGIGAWQGALLFAFVFAGTAWVLPPEWRWQRWLLCLLAAACVFPIAFFHSPWWPENW